MRRTAPLAEDFLSDADWLLPVLDIVWPTALGYSLDLWQRELLRAVLEVYPEGHKRAGQLRYRQVVISLARQNGKTEIAAALGLWGLLRGAHQTLIGIASNADQARLIYDRTLAVIRGNKALARRFQRMTETRGLRSHDGSVYTIKPSKSSSLQGVPVDLALVDELHLLRLILWTDLVNGTGGRPNGVVIGVTTAGSEDSEALTHLYRLGAEAIEDPGKHERFGFFCYEASEDRIPDDDATLLDLLMEANPALAEGRVDAENVIEDVRSMPPEHAIRYRLNRFIASGASTFLPTSSWASCQTSEGIPEGVRPVFAIDRTPDQGFASVAAAWKDDDGGIHTELVASIPRPTLESLTAVSNALMRHSPVTIAVDGYGLKDLAAELKVRGLPVRVLTQADQITAAGGFYAGVVQRRIKHKGDPLMSVQLPRTIRKSVGDAFRISRRDSSFEIDAVMATVEAVYAANTARDQALQVY